MVNVFSFCLYGPEKRMYYEGLIQNILIVQENFPGWKVYVYAAPDVTPAMLARLQSYPHVVLRHTGEYGSVNMIHRFYAIDEPDVDVMFSRDADSRIHWKDRWAIREFMNSPYVVHTIRDNVEHNTYMMGGLWGVRKAANLCIHELYEEFKSRPMEYGMGYDQNFLADKVYPRIIDVILSHYSFDNCWYEREHAVKFPFVWTNDVYCGRVELEELPTGEPPSFIGSPPDRVTLTNLLRRK